MVFLFSAGAMLQLNSGKVLTHAYRSPKNR